MGRPIVFYDGFFFEWSTICDAPSSQAMRRDDFIAWYRELHGSEGVERLIPRLDHAEKFGSSYLTPQSAEDVIACNRAGNNERELSFADVIALVHGKSDARKITPKDVR